MEPRLLQGGLLTSSKPIVDRVRLMTDNDHSEFVDITAEVDEVIADPSIQDDLDRYRRERDDADRAYSSS